MCSRHASLSAAGDYPADDAAVQGDSDETVLTRGGSVIVSPMGRILAGPNYGGECIQLGDLDLGEIAEGKYDFDVAGHYARPDIFRLLVNERPAPVATFSAEAAGCGGTLRSTLGNREQNK